MSQRIVIGHIRDLHRQRRAPVPQRHRQIVIDVPVTEDPTIGTGALAPGSGAIQVQHGLSSDASTKLERLATNIDTTNKSIREIWQKVSSILGYVLVAVVIGVIFMLMAYGYNVWRMNNTRQIVQVSDDEPVERLPRRRSRKRLREVVDA